METSVHVLGRIGLGALLIAASIGLTTAELSAQSTTESESGDAETDRSSDTPVDRGKMRLQLLIKLVENELEEATLSQSRLTAEAAALDQQRRALIAKPSDGKLAEQRQLDVIEQRLLQIDEEMADVNGRLPDIQSELADLQARLDEANGVLPEPVAETADNGATNDGTSQWLDGKRQVQEALVYLGGYNALIDGDFGPRTAAAVRAYQTQQGVEATGTLTDEQEAVLLSEAETLRARYGMRSLEDRDAGYRVTYPSGLLVNEDTAAADGRRYTTKDGQGELVLTSLDRVGASAITDMYQGLLAQYDIQYRRKRDDWFVVAGLLDDDTIIYDTARLNGDRVIRARLSYPAAWRDLWSPFAVIMFNSFEAVAAGQS